MYFFEADRSPEQPTVSEEELFYEQVYIEKWHFFWKISSA